MGVLPPAVVAMNASDWSWRGLIFEFVTAKPDKIGRRWSRTRRSSRMAALIPRVCNDAMTPEETVLAFHEAARRRDGSALDLIAEDMIQHAAGPQGRDGLRQTLATLDHDLDNPTTVIHRVVAQDDLVVVQLTMTGRHVGSTMPLFAGLTPIGNAIAWDFIHIWRVADGLIAEHWACRDDVGLLAQVGGWPR